MKYALQVAQYLYNTRKINLIFKNSFKSCLKEINLKAYCDSDFANYTKDRKSFYGFCIFIDKMLISWSFNKQSIVALSIKEAEIIAANESVRELLYIKNMVEEL